MIVFHIINIGINQEKEKQKNFRKRRCGVGRGIFARDKGRGVWRNFNISNNQNKRQYLKCYPHGTGLDCQREKFTKVKEHLILKIQSEFLNGSDISESIRKGVIFI